MRTRIRRTRNKDTRRRRGAFDSLHGLGMTPFMRDRLLDDDEGDRVVLMVASSRAESLKGQDNQAQAQAQERIIAIRCKWNQNSGCHVCMYIFDPNHGHFPSPHSSLPILQNIQMFALTSCLNCGVTCFPRIETAQSLHTTKWKPDFERRSEYAMLAALTRAEAAWALPQISILLMLITEYISEQTNRIAEVFQNTLEERQNTRPGYAGYVRRERVAQGACRIARLDAAGGIILERTRK
ncbi:uncharacterized protein BDR25DRAFT_359288 [Lindgomyces ingoldianus]|uniref:Uncharacterized protein n=1 Tax=Lindgomyces ingoldianus TaxID=673940 RepID=A0ACB6QIC8_9PLEO|nr:uncharacterized protein BDR25DRAFT_359288 [Lindgomyces ingoldianus]KAF2466784.1 hypothetical protein BDR25DRAFT_359288 [Lindgomyces ingoldianus]